MKTALRVKKNTSKRSKSVFINNFAVAKPEYVNKLSTCYRHSYQQPWLKTLYGKKCSKVGKNAVILQLKNKKCKKWVTR